MLRLCAAWRGVASRWANFFFRSDLHDVDNLKNVILMALSSSSEELKSSASYALGGVAIGNLQQYLPFVLNEIESQPKRQYLLLHSLKEVRWRDRGLVTADFDSFFFSTRRRSSVVSRVRKTEFSNCNRLCRQFGANYSDIANAAKKAPETWLPSVWAS